MISFTCYKNLDRDKHKTAFNFYAVSYDVVSNKPTLLANKLLWNCQISILSLKRYFTVKII